MNENISRLQQRLKVAAYLLIAGLIIEAVTLYWTSPLSFMLFIGVAATLMVLGIIVYLVAIVTIDWRNVT
jgi:membrane protein YdbS with pleckstrin-like domain